jgi:hypothetical protein
MQQELMKVLTKQEMWGSPPTRPRGLWLAGARLQ